MTAPTAAPPLPERVIREAILNAEALENWREAQRLGHEFDAVLTEAAHALREAAAALAQLPPTPADAIAIADAIRLRYAHDYEEKRADWQGNVYWAKVEAAAHIVRVLRHAAPTGIPRDDARAKALRWYGEQANAIARYACATPPNTEAMMAVVSALTLDAGKRAALHEPTPTEQPGTAGEGVST